MRAVLLCAFALILAAPAAAAGFRQTFRLDYTGGCKTSHPTPDSTTLAGCTNRGPASGTLGKGTATLRWTRRARAHSPTSTERGSVVFRSASGSVRFSYEGLGTLKGLRARGTWKVVATTGKLAALAGRSGVYTSVFERHGAHVVLVFTG